MSTFIAALALLIAVIALIVAACTAFLLIVVPEYRRAQKEAHRGEDKQQSDAEKRNAEFNRQIRNMMKYDGGDTNG